MMLEMSSDMKVKYRWMEIEIKSKHLEDGIFFLSVVLRVRKPELKIDVGLSNINLKN